MFLKLFTAAVSAAVMTSFAPNAFADQMGSDGDKFYEEAAHFENACMTGECKAPYIKKVVYDQKKKVSQLADKDKSSLKAVAFNQAQIWGDTILEGDYKAAGRTRLDHVVAFYKDNDLVGYKIQYSEKAWYTGECNYDGKKESLKSCREGRIIEGSYVSPDAETFFSDEERYAEFSAATI